MANVGHVLQTRVHGKYVIELVFAEKYTILIKLFARLVAANVRLQLDTQGNWVQLIAN